MTIQETGDRIFPFRIDTEDHPEILYRRANNKNEPNHLGGLNMYGTQVLKSAAGFYIGDLTLDNFSTGDEEPMMVWTSNSRDSQEYWQKREDAEIALMTGNYKRKF